jgi:hypothetical protein
MRERRTGILDRWILHCTNYWQSVLRIGLPFIILYRGFSYAMFRIIAGNFAWSYPWRRIVIPDVVYMFLVSTILWVLARQLAA